MLGLKFPEVTPEHTGSYYAASRTYPQNYPRLESHVRADIAIVGGGFSGVNTALELAERGYEVTLLEARRLSWGASGRNGGQIIGGMGSPQKFRKTVGEDGVQSLIAMGAEGPGRG